MTRAKPLSAKQLAVINDLFDSDLKESKILENHNLSRKLFDKWLTDEDLLSYLDKRLAWEHHMNELVLVRCIRKAISNLIKLTECDTPETARKACTDIITMRAGLLSGNSSTDATSVPTHNPKLLPESLNLPSGTAGKILAVLAEEKTLSTS